MGRIEQSDQIDAIFEGKITVPEAHEDVRTWFELTVYNLAMQIVNTPPDGRKKAASILPEQWRDDVLPLARKIVKESQQ